MKSVKRFIGVFLFLSFLLVARLKETVVKKAISYSISLYICLVRIQFILILLSCLVLKVSARDTSTVYSFFFDMGWIATSDQEGARIDYGISVDYNPGLRLEEALNANHSLLVELGYHNVHFHLNQDEGKVLPDTTTYNRERFYVHALSLGTYYRYRFESGVLFDVGIMVDYNFRTVHMVKAPSGGGELEKSFDDSIDYFEAFNTDLLVRLGYRNWTLHFVGRVSPLLKKSYGYPALPFGVLGVGYTIPLVKS